MRMITFKAKPKTIFGLIMAILGVLVIIISFASNHTGAAPSNAQAEISCKTAQERRAYIAALGWVLGDEESSREIVIPSKFNQVYSEYNKIQKEQGFDLENYKGQTATIYTYDVENYEGSNNVIADLIVINGVLVGADLCDTNAETGFLIGLNGNGEN